MWIELGERWEIYWIFKVVWLLGLAAVFPPKSSGLNIIAHYSTMETFHQEKKSKNGGGKPRY